MVQQIARMAIISLVNAAAAVTSARAFAEETPATPAPQEAPASASSVGLEGIGPQLARTLEREARRLIERHIAPEEFQVLVTVQAAESKVAPLPYMPETLAPILPDTSSPEELKPLIKQVDVEILLTEAYGPRTRAKLTEILTQKLALDMKRGDKIRFSALGIEIKPQKSDLEHNLSKVEQDARALQTRLDSLSKERDDAKRDLSLAKAESDRLARQVQLGGGAEKAGDKKKAEATGGGFWAENAKVVTVGVLCIISLLLGLAVFRGAAKVLGEAVRSIGDRLPVLGEKLAEASASRSPVPDALPAQVTPEPLRGEGAGMMPLEALQARAVALHGEILEALTESSETVVLQHLMRLLDQREQVGHAVAAMEILGKEKANTFFHKLSTEHQGLVLDFLKTGVYPRPKAEMLVEAGELLMTKLLATAITATHQTLRDDITARIMRLKTRDLAEVTRVLGAEEQARLFLYLEAPKLGALMAVLRELDPDQFAKSARLVAKIPESVKETKLDAELAKALDEQIAKTADDNQRPYFGFYRALVESVSDDVQESLVEELAGADPQVGRFVRENIITFGTFFRLQAELQSEIVDALPNKDVAALLIGLSDTPKSEVLALIDARRKPLVDEEVERLGARGQRQFLQAHRRAKQLIVKRILEMKGDGSLASLLKPAVSVLPETKANAA